MPSVSYSRTSSGSRPVHVVVPLLEDHTGPTFQYFNSSHSSIP